MQKLASTVCNIEDLVELFIKLPSTGYISKDDYKVFESLNKQFSKKIGLTDRQHDMVVKKLRQYVGQTGLTFPNIENVLAKTKYEIRTLNRNKSINLVDKLPQSSSFIKGPGPFIKITFPYSARNTNLVIKTLKTIKNHASNSKFIHTYDTTTKEYFFVVTESTVYHIVAAFNHRAFDIDQQLLDWYYELADAVNNPHKHLPGIYNYVIRNISDAGADMCINELGEPDENNILLYKDRMHRFGLNSVDVDLDLSKYSELSVEVATRKDATNVAVSEQSYSVNDIITMLVELKRFPVLITIANKVPATSLEALKKFNDALTEQMPGLKSSVMFRFDNRNSKGEKFNKYVSDNNLNHSITDAVDVVYISDRKLNKTIVKNKFQPLCVLTPGSLMRGLTSNSRLQEYMSQCDLVCYYNKELDGFKSHYEAKGVVIKLIK
jgi:hypothetical protein